MDLLAASLTTLLENQAPSGAFIASPTFANYQYSWFRDGAFCAYALDLSGEHAAARRFHAWAVETVQARAEVAIRAIDKATRGVPLGAEDILHTRYTLAGGDGSDQAWPNFQLDCFGTWLWALEAHLQQTGEVVPATWQDALYLTSNYLAALWQQPCYDCWEEFPNHIHPHTLAAIYAGLGAATRFNIGDWGATQVAIQNLLSEKAVYNGYFVKSIGSYTIDASLLGLAIPYAVFDPRDTRLIATVQRIEQTLVKDGGVRRYPTDTYYGGGEWVLLAGWLGWYYTEIGDRCRAMRLLEWMEAQANAKGELPEQVAVNLNDANYLQPWQERWGPSARPLLWSHAMYVILRQALAEL